jgi:glycosyltransferase involved in cell wall biosynthesis
MENNDNNFFDYDYSQMGGTEYQAIRVNEFLADMPKLKKYFKGIYPGAWGTLLSEYFMKTKVIWLHNHITQLSPEADINMLFVKPYQDTIQSIIVPSESAKNNLCKYGFPQEKISVIHNGVDFPEYKESKFKSPSTIKAIYISSSDRGLRHLLKAFPLFDESIELDIFTNMDNQIINTPWFKEASENPRISFYSKTMKKTVFKHLESAHMFLYPADYSETFCLSAAESLGAGLYCVTSNTGALKELYGDFIKTFDWDENYTNIIEDSIHDGIARYPLSSPHQYNASLENFVELVNTGIKEIKENKFNPKDQVETITKKYCWEAVKEQWFSWYQKLPEIKNS